MEDAEVQRQDREDGYVESNPAPEAVHSPEYRAIGAANLATLERVADVK